MKHHLSREIRLTIIDNYQDIDTEDFYSEEKEAVYIFDENVKIIIEDDYITLEKFNQKIKMKRIE